MTATADEASSRAVALQLLDERAAEVSFIRMQWVDHSGVLRARVLPAGRVRSMLTNEDPSSSSSSLFKAPSHALACVADNSFYPETRDGLLYWLLPDWSSLWLAVGNDTATVMCGLCRERAGEEQPNLCPRRALEETTRRARTELGLSFLVGFEVEFVVLKPGESADGGYFQPYGAHGVAGLRDPSFRHVEEAVRHMIAQGVAVDDVHTEGGRGQYEIALGALPPVQAADQLVFAQCCLKDVFARHGYTATMSPRPVADDDAPLTGQHMHVSIEGDVPADCFLAGILGRLPALCGVLMPLAASYQHRLRPYCAGDAVGWGTESRAVPVRGVSPRHWELRCADATANAYLGVAAVLAAGMLGVRAGEELTRSWPDLGSGGGDGDDGRMGPFGERLPEGIEAALDRLAERAEALGEVLGGSVLEHYLRMKRFESARLTEMRPEALTALLNELF